MQQYWGLRGRKLHAAVWAMAVVCVMIFGYNQAIAGGVLTTKSFQKQFPRIDTIDTTGQQKHNNSTIQGTVVALYTLTGTFGALGCTFLGDVWGRRKTIWACCLVTIVGCLLMGTSFQFAQFIVARIVLGVGVGGIIATTSVWQAELSRAESRGAHVSGFGISCGLGLALALWIAFGCSYVSSSFAWRFPFMIQIIFPVIVMSFIFTLPESPRWLIKMNRVEEARDIFSRIHDVPLDAEIVQREIQDVQLALELAKSVKLSAMFQMGPQRTFHRVCLAAGIQMFLQMSGVNSITYYASTIYEVNLGFAPKTAEILAASSQFVIIIGSVVASMTVDRFGRRALMLTSAASMALCQAALTGLVSQSDNKSALKAAVFFMFLYYFVYVLGFLGVPFLYASEIAPVHLRAAVCGVSTAVSWIFNFLVAEVTPVAFTDIGYRYFIVYCVINAFCVPVVYFFYPETAGRELEEIDEIFKRSNSIWDPVKVAKSLPKGTLAQFLVEDGKLEQPEHVEKASEHSKSDV